jgi:hypothetical protein
VHTRRACLSADLVSGRFALAHGVVRQFQCDAAGARETDASDFLSESASEVRRLVASPGVTGVVLDFGIACGDVIAPSDYIPAESEAEPRHGGRHRKCSAADGQEKGQRFSTANTR